MKTMKCKDTIGKEKVKASLTVEASILVPMALSIVVGGINLGFDLFQQVRTNAEIHEELVKLNPVDIVRKNTLIEEMK